MVAGGAEPFKRRVTHSWRFQPPKHLAQESNRELGSGWRFRLGACLHRFLSWDAARFMCYERPDSKWWEEAFVGGLRTSGASIPNNWSESSLTLNTLSAARSLANPCIQKRFIQELKMLVRGGLRGKRIG